MGDIGSCHWYPTFAVDTEIGHQLRENTRMKMVNQFKRSKIAYRRRNYGGYARDYGGYARDYGGYARKKPYIGRYPMGPTNIDIVDIGSCHWYPTFAVDTEIGHRIPRENTRMKMVNQFKRSKIAYRRIYGGLARDYGGYARDYGGYAPDYGGY